MSKRLQAAGKEKIEWYVKYYIPPVHPMYPPNTNRCSRFRTDYMYYVMSKYDSERYADIYNSAGTFFPVVTVTGAR